MRQSSIQLNPAGGSVARTWRVGPTATCRRELQIRHLCNASITSSSGASTSGTAASPPFAALLDGARRVMVVNALKANRTLRRQLKSGSPEPQQGLALMAALTIPPVPGNGITDLLTNRVFLVGFWSWFTAQFLKIFTKRFKKGVWDLGAVLESGGMPSSHSSLCAGITTAIAIQQGLGSALFAACLCFSVIVMYDAMGVRRHAGKQAEVLNKVIGELLDEDHPMGEVKLKEVLGHTPRQVICGGLLGLAVGLFFPAC
ncbi:hypothetical protein Agub_g4982 [Astrephomene gubernaculifera]|uniref:Acid phosphatase/vanadium-dependent haloperoxidase-related protein n=1 Tax=Astrephomene gubernaculifera TaxID=47775 RepID=A0AAD3DL54_9CHLO|nr:hypothetical protein Agub_g4982 [Astrephomene gubernaculifera]